MPFSGGSAGSPQRSVFRENLTNYGSPEGSSTAVFKRHIFILLIHPFYYLLPSFYSILPFMSVKAYACVIFSTACGYALSCLYTYVYTCVALPRAIVYATRAIAWPFPGFLWGVLFAIIWTLMSAFCLALAPALLYMYDCRCA